MGRSRPLLRMCAPATLLHALSPITGIVAHNRREYGRLSGVSHLLHMWWPRHLRALLNKLCNVEGEVLDRLIYLNIVLPGCCRPDPVVVFLQSAVQTYPP